MLRPPVRETPFQTSRAAASCSGWRTQQVRVPPGCAGERPARWLLPGDRLQPRAPLAEAARAGLLSHPVRSWVPGSPVMPGNSVLSLPATGPGNSRMFLGVSLRRGELRKKLPRKPLSSSSWGSLEIPLLDSICGQALSGLGRGIRTAC